MAFFQWTPELSVGIQDIDLQHKKLVDLINRLYDAIKSRQAGQILETILADLVDYTVTHFTYEEMFLDKNGYPELAAHKPKHNNFVAKIKQYMEDHKSGKLFLSTEIMDFLKDWLTSHIMGTDKEYAKYFSEKGLVAV